MTGRGRSVVWEWLPVLFLAVMFADLTSVSAAAAGGVHSVGPIMFERAVLGGAALSAFSKVLLAASVLQGTARPTAGRR